MVFSFAQDMAILVDKMMNLQKFIAREVKAKSIFSIKQIDKKVAYNFIRQHHYLGDARFFSKFSYGLYYTETNQLVGVATMTNPQGNVALKGWFGLENSNQTVMELSRLCVLPELNGTNATSYLLGNSIRCLKRQGVKALITLADDSRHAGSIYQVCNFKYYGLTDKKSDFFHCERNGEWKVNPRGATKDKQGVWINRTQKHRYAYIMAKDLKCLYGEQSYPKKTDTKQYDCCGGTKTVTDARFGKQYPCPKCIAPVAKTTLEEGYERKQIKIQVAEQGMLFGDVEDHEGTLPCDCTE